MRWIRCVAGSLVATISAGLASSLFALAIIGSPLTTYFQPRASEFDGLALIGVVAGASRGAVGDHLRL